ncbi:hypothetical protein ACQ86E_30670 [Bradyrhizobium betae]|uniref:hypothetical protein n=1 Tax=Bradyrhizobium betae TaxID=244734 RepID=UPI003D67DE69
MLNRFPNPRGETRRRLARERRISCASAAHERGQPQQPTNGEMVKYDGIWPTNYSKGLPHDRETGLVSPAAFEAFVNAINDAGHANHSFPFDVPIGPRDADKAHRPGSFMERPGDALKFNYKFADGSHVRVRNWESPRAGHVYDVQGPDAASLAISSFPKLGSDELTAEIAELYVMAFLRDVPVVELEAGGSHPDVETALGVLNALPWFSGNVSGLSAEARRRREARLKELQGGVSQSSLTRQTLFRGSPPGAKVGPFVSQFLLIENPEKRDRALPSAARVSFNRAPLSVPTTDASGTMGYRPAEIEDGYISWGAQRIDQRLSVHETGVNYLREWPAWLDAQNGADFRGLDRYEDQPRFITTLRDMATYVHFDALYQAYLNAYLLLGGFEARFDVGFPSGQNHPTRGSFATFGPPHFQTLLTEVASRGLKAVRRQKFNWQLRARPEYLAAMLSLAASDPGKLGPARADTERTLASLQSAGVFGLNIPSQLADTLIPDTSVTQPTGPSVNHLLPQAFPEGSPMHPSYGAGHATVAGACVTILKTVFQTYVDPRPMIVRDPLRANYIAPDFTKPEWWQNKMTLKQVGLDLDENGQIVGGRPPKLAHFYHPPAIGASPDVLVVAGDAGNLTLIGELNKLATNIAIARNIAGVHYYIDYYASLRLGERVATGILEEQLLSYPEPVSFRFESFDGDHIVLSGTGDGETVERHVYSSSHQALNYKEWWERHFVD